jgi:hypothetical protein
LGFSRTLSDMDNDERDEPTWTPWAYIGTGILGILIIIFALTSGQAGFIEALILGVSVAVIIVGVKKLRERNT